MTDEAGLTRGEPAAGGQDPAGSGELGAGRRDPVSDEGEASAGPGRSAPDPVNPDHLGGLVGVQPPQVPPDRSPPAVAGPHLPFSAVVAQDDAKTALLLAAVEPRLGGVLLRGDKGSAKTTLARGLAALLAADAPFVELPLGATEDRVVGSIDLAALLGDRTYAFRPGLLAAAHGGVLYVDEVNLLADHLVDTLLDVAVSGVNRVERDGFSETHPARFVLVGSMNPEEGELRPQLLDRFGLAVDVRAPTHPATRAEIVRRQMDFDRDGATDPRAAADDAELRARLGRAIPARVSPETIAAAARLAVAVGAEGLRADLSLCRAVSALGGLEGRPLTDPEDLRRVASFVLAHRRRRDPFEAPGLDADELDAALDAALGTAPEGDAAPEPHAEVDPEPHGQAAPEPHAEVDPEVDGDADAKVAPQPQGDAAPEPHGPADQEGKARPEQDAGPRSPDPVDAAPIPDLLRPDATARRSPLRRPAPGRGAPAPGPNGRVIGDVARERPDQRLAVRATAVAHATRTGIAGGELSVGDLRAAVAEETRASLVILAVDASGSMAGRQRLDLARRVVLGLLDTAYRRRDRVALIVFRGHTAEVVLRPTASIEIARHRLADVPAGGTTPLAAGLQAVTEMARAAQRAGGPQPVAVLITDGRATAGGADPWAAALEAAQALAATRTRCLVIDAETGTTRLGLARTLAATLGAEHLDLDRLERGGDDRAVERAIQQRLAAGPLPEPAGTAPAPASAAPTAEPS